MKHGGSEGGGEDTSGTADPDGNRDGDGAGDGGGESEGAGAAGGEGKAVTVQVPEDARMTMNAVLAVLAPAPAVRAAAQQ